ncbi:cyclic-di-AMP receptor [Acholeplasma hippikon]|uniref:cyclic-di-AMP receptor n=1 Tax=Acholeplasma hippikon TaxID=264636 RepID=UPI000552233B|nr:cyclic-di-AMP receptor [Acholeplasma hippikon]
MKMIIAIVSNDDANKVQKGLINEKFFSTRLATKGGFLREGNQTFLIGVNDEKVPEVLDIIEKYSKTRNKIVPNTIVNEFGAFSALPMEVSVGGATVFILNVDQFIKI